MLTKRQTLRKSYKRFLNTFSFRKNASVPVYILGEMRSGTNMLADCLDYCPRTEVFHENDDEAFHKFELISIENTVNLVQKSKSSHVVFKCIANSSSALELLSAHPNGRAVWIYRRYEDVVNSALRKWQFHNQYLYNVLHDEEKAAWRRKNMPHQHLQLIEHHYNRGLSDASARALIWYVRNDLYFQQELHANSSVWLTNYEDLVGDPEACLSQIFSFIDLQFRPAFVKHVSTKSIRKNPAPEVDEQIAELCADMKARLDKQLSVQSQQAA
ncbi:MAG: sulfotransferase domain-containing protein [Pseudomonadota bacterium]